MQNLIANLASKYRGHIPLIMYLKYLNITYLISSKFLVPIKVVKCLNLRKYYRGLKEDPESFKVGERFAEKRKRFPFFLRYRQWAMGVWTFTNCDFSSFTSPLQLQRSQLTSILERYNLGYSSKLEIAIMAFGGNTNAEEALSQDDYRAITLDHAAITDGVNWAHPNVDALHLLYLTNDISYQRYEDLFELAKQRDTDLVRRTAREIYTDFSTSDENLDFLRSFHIVPNEGTNEVDRTNSPIWARYDDLFGDQYTKLYKHK